MSNQVEYNVPFGSGDSNFDTEFQEVLAFYRGIEDMDIDADGTIHLTMSTGEVKDYDEIKDLFELSGGIIFRGVVNSNSDLPSTHLRGWLYLVGTAGQYAGQKCEPGDIIICVKDATEQQAQNSDWTIVQTNLDPDLYALKNNTVLTGSLSLGRKANTIIGENSSAVGLDVTAEGMYSHAEGYETLASGMYSHAEGINTKAEGNDAHTEGTGTIALRDTSHAEGYMTTALGISSHAEGEQTVAGETGTHAQGCGVAAFTPYSNAFGKWNIPGPINKFPAWRANTEYRMNKDYVKVTIDGTVKGYVCIEGHTSGSTFDSTKWMECGTTAEYLEIVGNGLSFDSRSNARALNKQGDEYLKGKLYINCNANSANGQEVAIKNNAVLTGQTTVENLVVGGVTAGSGYFSTTLAAPTKAVGTNTTDVATTAFVKTAIDNSESGTATELGLKADKVQSATNGNFAGVNASGNLTDSGKKPSDFVQTSDVANNLTTTESGKVLDARQGKALKDAVLLKATRVPASTNGNFAGLNASGDLTDSGKKPSDFVEVLNIENDLLATAAGKVLDARQGKILNDTKAPKSNPVFTGSISLGRKADTTVGDHSSAIGYDTVSSGFNSHAEGYSTTASGNGAHAEGADTTASGLNAHVEGEYSVASGEAAHTEGLYTNATAMSAHAEGNHTTASGNNSHAEGVYTIANGANQHVSGKYNIADTTSLEIIGNGTGTNARKNARLLDVNGNEKLKGELYINCNDDSTGGTAVGAGLALKAPIANPSFTGSISLGRSGDTGTDSVAEGHSVTASGNYSHAEGEMSTSSGYGSHAEGFNTKAKGYYSHSEGYETEAEYKSQHVLGEYNVKDPAEAERNQRGSYVEIVGNGTSVNNKSNARVLDWSGNERLKGDLYVGCNADSTGGTKVAKLTDIPAIANNLTTTTAGQTLDATQGKYLNDNKLNTSLKGAANGLAELDSNGLVPSSQLPSYVDDVLEYANLSSFPATGETGKIYVALDTNKTYRWSGSTYVEISPSLALGTTSSTAYRGDRGNAAYKHAVTNKGAAFASGLYKITTNGEGHVTDATAVVKTDITDLGIPAQDTTYSNATTSAAGLMSSSDKTKLDSISSGAAAIDDTAGNGDTTVTWSADKIYDQLDLKAPKASPVFTGSISLGRKTNTNIGSESFAVGFEVTASDNWAHAEGAATVASAVDAHAEGSYTIASGFHSHAEGDSTKATINAAHAEGQNTEASGRRSHSEGYATKAIGKSSHAEGSTTVALADNSHAEGNKTVAGYNNSHAQGTGVATFSGHSHAFGKWNIPGKIENYPVWTADTTYNANTSFVQYAENNVTKGYVCIEDHVSEQNFDSTKWLECGLESSYVEIVGNGDDNEHRSNARTLDWSGNEEIAGNFTAKGGSITIGNTTITEAQLQYLLSLMPANGQSF